MGVWAARASAVSCSVIVNLERSVNVLIMIGFVKEGIGLSDKDASLLRGTFTDCSLRQKVWGVFSSVTVG